MIKKFGKILIYTILTYIACWAFYNVFLLLQVLDLHFIIISLLFAFATLWLAIGLWKPKKLRFFAVTQKRIVMVLIYIAFLYMFFIAIILMETMYYKRDPINYINKNISYLRIFFQNTKTFSGDSYSLTNPEKLVESLPENNASKAEYAQENYENSPA